MDQSFRCIEKSLPQFSAMPWSMKWVLPLFMNFGVKTGATVSEIMRAYSVTRSIFKLPILADIF